MIPLGTGQVTHREGLSSSLFVNIGVPNIGLEQTQRTSPCSSPWIYSRFLKGEYFYGGVRSC